MDLVTLFREDPIATMIAIGVVVAVVAVVVWFLSLLIRDDDHHDPNPQPTAYRERTSSLVETRKKYQAALVDSHDGRVTPSGQCVGLCIASRWNTLTAGQQAAYHAQHEAELQQQYAHASSIYADPYQEQAAAQAEEPAYTFRNDQTLQQPAQPPAPVVQQYIPLEPHTGDTQAWQQDQYQDGDGLSVDQNGAAPEVVYVRLRRG